MPGYLSVTQDGERGHSFIELMVALVLLAVALAGLAAALPPGLVGIEQGNQLTTATNLARQTLEGMRNRVYTEDTDELILANYPPEGYGTIPDFPSFRRVVTIQDGVPEAVCVPAPPTPCSKRVRVDVFFRDSSGTERSVAFSTIFVR